MGPYKPDIGYLKFILDSNNETIGIPFDIENNTVIRQNTRRSVLRFNLFGVNSPQLAA